ncbi:AAA family ATPase [Bacillus horti]|uniref:Adenylate kinase family enzyme n=1 Tax=Caldalkalibacillus horti TaxID=77523 RepID=A0ABT9VY02_9BACI|nr:AAA family ATPase [Bacillus horti]MDQ0165755.1 adenylate kinase family enzyme [Bacillus horti]
MKNRIHIFGASGSGASTLGQELSSRLPHINFDGDDYYWREKFSEPREPVERLQLLTSDLSQHRQWIVSGAVCGWGDALKSDFELVIFLYVPSDIRLQRLKDREIFRYGEKVLLGGSLYEQSRAFLDWSALYDNGGLDIRSKELHENWISSLTCPILRIEGDTSISERVSLALEHINS